MGFTNVRIFHREPIDMPSRRVAFSQERIRLARHIIIGIWVWRWPRQNLLPWLPAALSWRVSRQLPRHYTPGTSLKYANTQLSGRPFRFLGRLVHLLTCMRRNVYDQDEIKSTAKILPLIRMWSPLLLSLRRPRPSSMDPSKPATVPALCSSGGTQD